MSKTLLVTVHPNKLEGDHKDKVFEARQLLTEEEEETSIFSQQELVLERRTCQSRPRPIDT